MANLGGTYEADPQNVAGDYTPVPPGDYLVMVVSSDIRDAKKPGNRFIELSLLIMDGPEKNRKLTDRINLWNDNPKAVEIAQRSFNALIVACGKLAVQDTAELHNILIIATVKVDPGKPYTDNDGVQREGGPQNSVRTYRARDAATPAASPTPAPTQTHAAQTAAPAAAAGGGLPWKKQAA